jgi:glycogen operon protein
VEGPSDDPAIDALRNRQVKNALTLTLLSLGVPMILMGDEVRHSQGGNNNAYCHDNVLSWLDWARLKRHADVHRFLKLLIARRLLRDDKREHLRTSLNELIRDANKAWHGVRLDQPDWGDASRSIALTVEARDEALRFHLIINAYWEPLAFQLPPASGGTEPPWRRWIDTALASPNDIVAWDQAPEVPGFTYKAEARSVVVLHAPVR